MSGGNGGNGGNGGAGGFGTLQHGSCGGGICISQISIDGNGGAGGNGGSGGNGAVALSSGGMIVVTDQGSSIKGGTGGNGGNGGDGGRQEFSATGDGGDGGRGGDGGAGVVLTGGTILTTSAGTSVSGGNGGRGGTGGSATIQIFGDLKDVAGNGGAGGNGGNGVTVSGGATVVNAAGATIAGGDAGHGGNTGIWRGDPYDPYCCKNGADGAAGAGVSGSGNMNVINAGTIEGGLNIDGSRASAIVFGGGDNTLELRAGSNIIGNIVATLDPNNPNTLVLGGDRNASFDLSDLGGRYQGFSIFNKTGAGTWTLSGAPTSFTGDTGIYGGTLVLASGARLTSGNAIIGSPLGSQAGGLITGSGSVWTAGSMSVSGYGSDTLTIQDGGSVKVSGDLTIGSGPNSIAGTGDAVTVDGAGSRLSVNGTTYVGGALTIENGGIVDSRQMQIGFGDTGSATVTVTGTGSSLNAVPSISIFGFSNNSLTVADGASAGILGDSSSFIIGSSADPSLAGALNIGAAANITAVAPGTLKNNVVFGSSSGSLNFNHTSSDYTFAPTISGPGAINFLAGTTILTGNSSSFTGRANVSNSTLVMAKTGSLGGTLAVDAGGRLEGSGAVGATTINSGGTIAPSDAGALTINGNLALQAGATFGYRLADPSSSPAGAPGIGSSVIKVNGDLALNGATLDIASDSSAPSIGYHRLIHYTGGLSQSGGGLIVGSTPVTSPVAYTYSIDTSSYANYVDLLVRPDGLNVVQVWGGGTDGVGTGSGTWNAGNANWLDPIGGTAPTQWGSVYGIFRGTGGTVTVEGQQSAIGLQFAGGTYTLATGAGGSLELVKSSALQIAIPGIDVLAGETATVGVTITGVDGLQKTSDGTLILSGANTYSGGTIVSGGTLQISADNNLGAASGGLTLDNATLRTTADIASARTVNLRASGAFETAAGTTFSVSGNITGAGGLIKAGDGTLALSGSNSWSGGTLITAGTLRADSASALPSFTDYVLTGGTLDLNGHDLNMGSLAGTGGNIAIAGASLSVLQAFDAVYAGTISGAGMFSNFTKTGSGTLLLTGNNTYGGETHVDGGTLAIISASNLGSGPSTSTVFIDGATLATLADISLDRWVSLRGAATVDTLAGTTFTLSNQIFGASGASLIKQGAGALVLAGDNSYDGGTTVAAGTLQIGNGGNAGSIIGNVLNNSLLAFNRSDSYDFGGVISGTGAVAQIGSGTTILTGTNTYTGNTFILAGTLQLGNGGTSGSITGDVLNNGTLSFNRSDVTSFAGLIAGSGSLTQAGPGTTVLTANNTYTGGTTIAAGTLQLGDGGRTGWITGNVLDNGTLVFNRADDVQLDGVISGSGAVRQMGSGATVLTADNTYLGGTAITAGALVLGNGGASGSVLGDVTDNGILAFNRSDAFGFGGVISGTGSVQQIGAGTTVLTGASTYSGGTLIAAGTLQIGDGGTAGAITGDVQNNGTLAFNRSDNVVFSGKVWGSGALAQIGSGTTVLTASNAYGSGVTISAGTLQVGDGGTSGSLDGDVANNSRLVFNRSDVLIFGGAISGTGSLAQIGSGATVLAGDSTYTGGTTISAGVLVVGDGQTSGSIVGNVANAGILVFNRADSYAFDGQVSGTGSVVQLGSGTTLLAGVSSYTGETVVEAGRLSVNGSIASSSRVTVNAGGTLGGNGIVGPTFINGGALAPGNSIGLLTVQGNLSFTAASSYMVEVSAGKADRVNVTGSADLGGATVHATFDPGSYVMRRYTIVNAAGGLDGSTFRSEVNTDLPANFTPSLSYDAKNVYLELAMNISGLTVNQQNVSTTLVNYFYQNGQIPLALGRLDAAGLTQASGELATGVQQTTVDVMNLFMGTMIDPFLPGRGGGASASDGSAALAYASGGREDSDVVRRAFAGAVGKAPPAASFDERWSVWVAGLGGTRTTAGNGVVGSHNVTDRIYGAAVGADYRVSSDTLLGFALAGGGTSFNLAGGLGTGRSDLFQAGVFTRHAMGNAYLSGVLAYGWQDITTDRMLTLSGADRLRANFHANALSGRIEGGYRIATPWMGVMPYAAGQVVHMALPAYAEAVIAGADTFALDYASRHVTAIRSELGVRADKSLALNDAILTLRGRAAWAHDFDPGRAALATFQTLPDASFIVNGAGQSPNTALASASAELKWLNGVSLAATFDGEFSRTTTSYAGKGVVRLQW
ncbi:autotransporter-associated beta strand repeat-containing protein [Bradyrhizobium sp. AC87j1]|uniref:autotransporter-associated beta strand repeat-containing protein n=1 Tax=Bradyrhizobium sp. AC87j1 TaxID=2055894 RepID=UPI001AECC1F4|nr:autotransporter-associated beta strand repeat-containing protein [Bradyrhizobium sp. AC87j1]